MNIFYDSTYFFPAIGIEVEKIPINFVTKCKKELPTASLFYSEITLFELQAKGARYVKNNKLDTIDVNNGIQAILNDDRFMQKSFITNEITEIAIELRNYHSDFIDCLIVASGMVYADYIVTEDGEWNELVKNSSKFKAKQIKENICQTSEDFISYIKSKEGS